MTFDGAGVGIGTICTERIRIASLHQGYIPTLGLMRRREWRNGGGNLGLVLVTTLGCCPTGSSTYDIEVYQCCNKVRLASINQDMDALYSLFAAEKQDSWQARYVQAQRAAAAYLQHARHILFEDFRKVSAYLAPYKQPLQDSYYQHGHPYYKEFSSRANSHFEGLQPWQVALLSVCTTLLLVQLWRVQTKRWGPTWEKGLKQSFFDSLKRLPIVRGVVAKERQKLANKLKASLASESKPGHEPLHTLPLEGLDFTSIKERLAYKSSKDVQFNEGNSKVSGTLYMAGEEHCKLLNDIYTLFSHTNPMHSDVFPSVRQMESEVIAMTAALLGGGRKGDPNICGAMTSGGTESILSAVKASRDFMRATKGITEPEMIIGDSAHAAFFKAAEYFKIKIRQVPVGRDYRVSASSVRRKITRNTILIVASSPGFPHGVVDHVADLGKLAQKYKVCLHSDACLGGFVLPFAQQLGYNVPDFDFRIPGVTSMSIDTHKFGMAHKGTSVVLYRNPDIRRYQYTQITEWSGGLYISPGFAGSRSGALIATAWTSMAHLGQQQYLQLTDAIMKASKEFISGVKAIPELEVVGDPEMSVVAFKARNPKDIDIFVLNDLLSQRGWHLSALQNPSALHMCFTAQHVHTIPALIKDLTEATSQALKKPTSKEGSLAPVYGMNAKMPDRNLVGEYLVCYQDALLSL